MARKTRRVEPTEAKMERWIAGAAATTSEQREEIRNRWEAGNATPIEVDGCRYERLWLADLDMGAGYVVIGWDDAGYLSVS